MSDNTDLNTKIEAIRSMLSMFRFERIMYIIVTLLSFLALLTCSVIMVFQGSKMPVVVAMFGSSGGIAFTCGRLLKMWGDSMKLLAPSVKNEDGN